MHEGVPPDGDSDNDEDDDDANRSDCSGARDFSRGGVEKPGEDPTSVRRLSKTTKKYIIRTDVMASRWPRVCDAPADREAHALYERATALAGEPGRASEALPLFRRAAALSPALARLYGIQ